MKATLLYILFMTGIVFVGQAQCNPDALAPACNTKLGDFTFIKNYKIETAKTAATGTAEFSYVFSKDTQYFISICDGKSDSPKIEVTLLDKDKKTLATNMDKGKYYPGIAYKCTTTGIYYMSFNVSAATDKCAVSALGFKK